MAGIQSGIKSKERVQQHGEVFTPDSIVNDMLFELFPEMIHKSCKSYQSGIGCGKIVQEVSRKLCNTAGSVIGWKSDLSKYFDTVPIEFIDKVFDEIEEKTL